LCWH